MSGRTLPRKIFSAGCTKVSFERKMGHMLGHTKGSKTRYSERYSLRKENWNY